MSLLQRLHARSRRLERGRPVPSIESLKVTITASHIAQGRHKDAWHCPLALACNEQLGEVWLVQPPVAWKISQNIYRTVYPLSPEAQHWVEAWDRGERMAPLTLTLDDPLRESRGRDAWH